MDNHRLYTDVKHSGESEVLERNTQYLLFLLGKEQFGVEILHIKEIIEYINVARVPMVPDYIRGVINLRGNVVPVIDLASRFHKSPETIGPRTCIVVVEIKQEDDKLDVGFIVDSVNEVLSVNPQDIKPAPAFGASISVKYIQGMGRVDQGFATLINIYEALNVDELSMLAFD
ncbi:MAG: chemotaxis protein CheW [Gammaproteobacteria bacterium]|nr:chemotaxis protein CheW [Gammaproteobacteria bacterium]MDH5802337.1 chemotaxis protein CheW [Gammaproteobacteria bacterium]